MKNSAVQTASLALEPGSTTLPNRRRQRRTGSRRSGMSCRLRGLRSRALTVRCQIPYPKIMVCWRSALDYGWCPQQESFTCNLTRTRLSAIYSCTQSTLLTSSVTANSRLPRVGHSVYSSWSAGQVDSCDTTDCPLCGT